MMVGFVQQRDPPEVTFILEVLEEDISCLVLVVNIAVPSDKEKAPRIFIFDAVQKGCEEG